MVSTSCWRVGSVKRPHDGIYSQLYVIQNHFFFGQFYSNRISISKSPLIRFDVIFYFADKVKNAANITLLALMLLAIYNHWMVNDAFERIGSALVFTFMLTGRLVVWYQISRREAKINAATQAQANGLKQD